MRAIVIHEFGGRDKLLYADVPQPEPADGEVLIRVHAAGINPVDWKIREGNLKDRGIPHQFPLIPGWDLAGVVEQRGLGAKRFQIGEAVYAYCRRSIIHNGTYAQYICLPESYLSRKPVNLSFEEAACVPLAALTAYQALFDAAGLQKGETVLIVGASGGVGSFAVQLAKNAEAEVTAVAGAEHQAYLKQLGADHTLDYQREDFRQGLKALHPQGVDLAFACAGGESLIKAYDCVRPGGRLATIVEKGDEALARQKGIHLLYVFVEPNAAQLDILRTHLEYGRLKVHVSRVFEWTQITQAHQHIESGHTRGKIVLKTLI
ncbi:MAG TPA: NADP-dependent oxidoreductase [Candidatus Omnitrophica bacterium]|nr:MAG: hypothetical protein A2Z81_08280 [Omnitrophica WOR_2 bacterium GWA2_45_18]HBR15530.1 NADP-dependent oxidoreductase [Candidatus Omnitrophota bacterium]